MNRRHRRRTPATATPAAPAAPEAATPARAEAAAPAPDERTTTAAARAALLEDDAAQAAADAASPAPPQAVGAAPSAPAPLAAVAEGEPPLVPLGHRGGLYHYYSRPYGRICELPPEKHTRLPLLGLAPLAAYAAWLRPDLPPDAVERQESAILRAAGRRLLEATQGRTFDPCNVRMRGIWAEDDGGGIIYNSGQACYLATGNAPPVQVEPVRPPFVYASGKPLPAPAEPLTYEQGRALLRFLSARSWTWPHAGELLTGFLANALLAGALPYRGHIWVNAPRNTGKTFLRDDLIRLLAPFCSVSDGAVSTPAALRADLNGAPVPVICDEQDADAGDTKSAGNVTKKLELARIASKGGKVSMGTSGGGATRDYTLLSCFLFLSVDNMLCRDTDLSRWALLRLRTCTGAELDALLAAQRAARDKLPPDGRAVAAIIGRLLHEAAALRGNLEPLAAALRAGGAEPRRAEMFSVWLAGAYALTHGGVMDAAAIARAVEVAKSYAAQEEPENDFARCMDFLRNAKVQYQGLRLNVETICGMYANAGEGEAKDAMKAALASLGITYTPAEKLLVQASPAFIRSLFIGTEYEARAVSVLTAGCTAGKANEHGIRLTSSKLAGMGTPRRAVLIPAYYIETTPAT